MITIPHLNTDCQDPWGDEIPIFGEVDPLEHLAPELEAAVLDTARALLNLGQDATMVQRRIHAALDGAVRSVTRPDSPMLWKGTPFELARLRANAGPSNGRDKLDTVQAQVEAEEPAAFELEPNFFEDEVIA